MKTIYLDLDGVLANFNLQLESYMTKYNLNYYKSPDETWADFENKNNVSIFELLYSKLSKQEILIFWATMPKFSWTDDLINFFNSKKIVILTAITKKKTGFPEECKYGKLYWGAINAPKIEMVTCYREDKKLYANMDALLIDDYSRNVEEFKKIGGNAILFKNYETFKKDIKEWNI